MPTRPDEAQLALLQAELQSLKAGLGRSLRLQRATPAEAPATAPFPIVLTFDVQPPAAAAAYDVSDAVRIRIHLHHAALELPHVSTVVAGPATSLPGTQLEVLSDELPAALRARMAEAMTTAWAAALRTAAASGSSGGGGGGGSGGAAAPAGPYRLGVPAAELQQRFVSYITLLPHLIEPYQAEDEHGATVRRYAIINDPIIDGGGGGASEAAAPSPAATAAPSTGTGAAAAAAAPATSPAAKAPIPPAAAAAAMAPPPASASAGLRGSLPSGSGSASRDSGWLGRPGGSRGDVTAAGPAARSDPAVSPAAAGAAAAGAQAVAEPMPTAPSPLAPARSCPPPPLAQDGPAHASAAAPTGPQCLTGERETGVASGGVGARVDPPVPPSAQASTPTPLAQAPAPHLHAPPAPPGLLPYDVATKELQYMRTRYRELFNVHVEHDGPGGGGASAGPHRGPPAAPSTALLAPGCQATFDLELLPTDPDWTFPALRVAGQLLPVSPTLWLPSLGVHMACRLPPWLRGALEDALAAQLAAAAAAQAAAVGQGSAPEHAAQEGAEGIHAAAGGMSGGRAGGGDTAGGRGLGGGGARGAGSRGGGRTPSRGPPRPATVAAAEVQAPEGTVLLPLGTLRNLLRDLENYAGTVARNAREAQRQAELGDVSGQGRNSAAARDGRSGGSGSSSGDERSSGGGIRYDDDGYGDGSGRRAVGGGSEGEADDADASSSGDGGDSDSGDSDGGADEVCFSGAAGVEGGGDLPAAYAVVLEGLQLDNVAVLEALRVNLEIACSRCGTRSPVSVSTSAASASGQCLHCTAAWALQLRPHYVHATSNSLCVIKPQGCRPLDLLPSMLAGQCSECSAVMALREVQVGSPYNRSCSSCHKELAVSIAAVSFVPRGPPKDSGSAARRGATSGGPARSGHQARSGSDGTIQPGQPLPALGTCKHYRHSYRWLRFPCCGMRFACDLCHEEAVTDGHPAKWATRMTCGYCATEQPVALGCRACGRQVAGTSANPSGRRTRFWEGGTGCRDLHRLNKNDPHKWRGRNKTTSAKASRVGPKPWSGKGGGGAGG